MYQNIQILCMYILVGCFVTYIFVRIFDKKDEKLSTTDVIPFIILWPIAFITLLLFVCYKYVFSYIKPTQLILLITLLAIGGLIVSTVFIQ